MAELAQVQRTWREKLEVSEQREKRVSVMMKELEAAAEERQTEEAKKCNAAIKSLNEDLEAREATHTAKCSELNEMNMNLESNLGKRNSELCAAKDREIELNKALQGAETKAEQLVCKYEA
jgi:hypothetical protein